MATTVTHHIPTLQHAIADLTGYEDADTLRWQQACVHAAQQLTGAQGRYAGTDTDRLAQGLDLAQRGGVTLAEALDDLQRRGRERQRPLHRRPGAARLSMPGLSAAQDTLHAPAGGGDSHWRTRLLRGLCAAPPAGHHPASDHHQPAGGARSDRLWAATCASHPHRAHAPSPGPSPDGEPRQLAHQRSAGRA